MRRRFAYRIRFLERHAMIFRSDAGDRLLRGLRTGTALVLAVFAVAGCSWFQPKLDKSAVELASDGMDEYNSGDFASAIEHFEKLRDWYPFSKYAILAELKIADAHYQLEEYEEAIFAYQEFENLHPLNEAIPYVVYQIGRSHFDRIDTVDRDQTHAQEALKTFRRLIRQFPDDSHSRRAEGHIHRCLQSLAGHEFYVGYFYYKGRHYDAALSRFKTVIEKYPDVGVHFRALRYIARCEHEMLREQVRAGNEEE
jgi:outer membrane protein assembly factor BamD